MYLICAMLDKKLLAYLLTLDISVLGQPLSCKLKGRPFVMVVIHPSVCSFVVHGCIVAKQCNTIRLRLLLIISSGKV